METKKEFRFFTIFEYEKEQEYLRSMHKSGWKFIKVTGFGVYHFEACEPVDVVYQLDYNKEGLSNQEEYVKMFADCGWEHLQNYAGYSYFRKPVSESGSAEEIFCDEESRIQMMERVLKGRMLPVLCLFFAVLIPQFILNLVTYRTYLVATFLGGILIIYLVVFLHCAKTMHKYKNPVK